MASRVRLSLAYPDATEPERPPPSLFSELLEEIFLRVASPADLARASAACVAFHRIITDHSFLRRYRSIHPPLLLGFVSVASGFQPVVAPHPSAPVARAVAFSFDFLPRPHHWYLCDVRDGRVLVNRDKGRGPIYDLAVCDPLSGQYLLLPPITDDLLASVGLLKSIFLSRASLIPSRRTDEEDASFSVINAIQSLSRLGVFIFSSGSSCWSVSTSVSWQDDLGLDRIDGLNSGHCAYDCFYWTLEETSTVIKLDMNSMQFGTIDLLPGHDHERGTVVVESEESKVAMFSLLVREATSVDYYTFPKNGSEKSYEWHMKSTIPLPDHFNAREWCIRGPVEGYIFIERFPDEEPITHSTFFSLEIKSFNIERVGRTSVPFYTHPYFGFPPSMSPRRI